MKLNAKEPYILGTLAAAYAETGQFKKALDHQQQAIDMLEAEKRNDEADKFYNRMDLYSRGWSFRTQP